MLESIVSYKKFNPDDFIVPTIEPDQWPQQIECDEYIAEGACLKTTLSNVLCCPNTWTELPSGFDPNIALNALYCIEDSFGEIYSNPTDIIDITVGYIDYVKVMKDFYNVMGIVRCLFSIFLVIYVVGRYLRKSHMNMFQHIIINLIQLLTIVQIVYSFEWNYKIFQNCEQWSRVTGAFVDLTMFLIGTLVTYFMYLAVNMIHYFSKKGRLPKE